MPDEIKPTATEAANTNRFEVVRTQGATLALDDIDPLIEGFIAAAQPIEKDLPFIHVFVDERTGARFCECHVLGHLGERGMEDTEVFTEKLHEATSGHFQLTTDGFRPYENAVSYSLGTRVDYAMLIKVYGANPDGEQKYSPPVVVETATKIMIGARTLAEYVRQLLSVQISASVPVCAVSRA
jgi:hypothetical protein